MDRQSLMPHQEMLFRFALLHLHDEDAAHDAVQETLLAALQAQDRFRNESALRTWLIGILKHKIADHFRFSTKFHAIDASDSTAQAEQIEDLIFNHNGHWIGTPADWKKPDHALETAEFWQVFEFCQNNLPENQAKTFMLREMVGLEAEEICREMNISNGACRVNLHRARLALRECLEQRWFNAS
jgi:RNA polymerase sigma-70 factor (ECF subfamily)